MQLGDVLDDLTLDVATAALEVTRVEIDSRACEPGTLFFALQGIQAHGAEHAADAVARGAVAVVSDRPVPVAVPVLVVPASLIGALVAHASAVVVGEPQTRTKLVAVTGTNGKTTVTTLVADLARRLGWSAGTIGTLTGARTTPAAPELYRALAREVDAFDPANADGVVALEVSSHALDQHRVEGLFFCVAAFTNLGHEHLDYHGTMEAYFAAKASLFTPERARRAVIWTDDHYGARLADETVLPVTPVGRADADEVVSSLSGSTFFWRGHLVNSPLVGDYNVDNVLVALAIAASLGLDEAALARAVSELAPVPGRFEVIHGHEVTVVVDYAHTPEGLARLLDDVRALEPTARVVTVFGAGGDRDRTKRPEMGAAVAARSDAVVLTSDNPRSESPDAIMDDVAAGIDSGVALVREVDRRRAIATAIEAAGPGDVVVVAGKGHETTQTVGDTVVPFDDREVAREYVR